MADATPSGVTLRKRQFDIMSNDLKQIKQYLDDPDITDIFVQPTGDINYKSFTKGKVFTGEVMEEVQRERIIKGIANMAGLKIDPETPIVESLIPIYNARFTGVLFPIAEGANFTIRKPPSKIFTLEEYLRDKRVSQENYDLLVKAIEDRQNILVGGSTGAGKTTLLNAIIKKMSEFTPDERFYIVEDVPEIKCETKDHLLFLCKPETAVTMVRLSLRESPDRIIFGEIRYGNVANEVLKSWNTGHSGNCTTTHANSCASMMYRMKGLLSEVNSSEGANLSNIIHLLVHITYKPGFGPYIDEIQKSSIFDIELLSVVK